MADHRRSGIRVLDEPTAPTVDSQSGAASPVQLRRIPLRHPAAPEAPSVVVPPAPTGAWAKTFRARRLLVDIVALVIIVGLAWLMWPTNIGGSTAYVIIKGTSMEPKFHTGDLAIVRTQDHYGVGDIVAYRIPKGNPGAGHLVIHRIIGHSHGGFLMQGINRTTPDAFYPKPSDVLGRYRFLIGLPGIGFWTLLPWICCALVGVGVVWIAWPRAADPDDVPTDPGHGAGDGPDDQRGRGPDVNADAVLVPSTPVIVGQRRLRRMEAEAQRAKHRAKPRSKPRSKRPSTPPSTPRSKPGSGHRRHGRQSVPLGLGALGIIAVALAIIA